MNPKVCAFPSFLLHVCEGSAEELFVTASLPEAPADSVAVGREIYQELARLLAQTQMEVVHERIFGSLDLHAAVVAARNEAKADSIAWRQQPLTYIQGQPVWGSGLAGIQIQAVAGPVHPITEDGTTWGRWWQRNDVTFALLQNLHGLPLGFQPLPDQALQAEAMFDRAHQLLRSLGGGYPDIVRTWIYLADILGWYDAFNQVRNRKYGAWELMPLVGETASNPNIRLPASTGIRGENPLEAACLMDTLALIAPAEKRPKIAQLSNVKQKDAFRYGRAFSRGAWIQHPTVDYIQVSGTAAIDEQGVSLYPGDSRRQIIRTLENIEALLKPAGASLKQTTSATLFFKRAEDAAVYREIAAERGLAYLPAVSVVADVCRPELLFEMDALVVRPH